MLEEGFYLFFGVGKPAKQLAKYWILCCNRTRQNENGE